MKPVLILTLLTAIATNSYSQNLNPYEQFGYQTKDQYVMTKKSEGLWLNNKEAATKVKNLLIDLKNKQMVVINENDSVIKVFDIPAEALTRFISGDPLTKKYPELTPYQFASNRQIDGIDLDGLEWTKNVIINTVSHTITTENVIKVKVVNQTVNHNNSQFTKSIMDGIQRQVESSFSGAFNDEGMYHTIKQNLSIM